MSSSRTSKRTATALCASVLSSQDPTSRKGHEQTKLITLASHLVRRIHRAAEARDKQPWRVCPSGLVAGCLKRFCSLRSAHCLRSNSTIVCRLLLTTNSFYYQTLLSLLLLEEHMAVMGPFFSRALSTASNCSPSRLANRLDGR
jgi:hypothetical protein